MQLDCYEYCTEEYRKELDGARAAAAAIDNKRIAASQASKAQVRALDLQQQTSRPR